MTPDELRRVLAERDRARDREQNAQGWLFFVVAMILIILIGLGWY